MEANVSVSRVSSFYVARACLLNGAVALWTFPRLEHGIASLSSGAAGGVVFCDEINTSFHNLSGK